MNGVEKDTQFKVGLGDILAIPFVVDMAFQRALAVGGIVLRIFFHRLSESFIHLEGQESAQHIVNGMAVFFHEKLFYQFGRDFHIGANNMIAFANIFYIKQFFAINTERYFINILAVIFYAHKAFRFHIHFNQLLLFVVFIGVCSV